MSRKELRYAKEGDQVFIEEAIYLKGGEGAVATDDPRIHEIPNESGKWLALVVSNFLGVVEDYSANTYHGSFPIRSGVTLITAQEYHQTLADFEQTTKEKKVKKKDLVQSRKERLQAKHKAGELFPNDPMTFEDTYGFKPSDD